MQEEADLFLFPIQPRGIPQAISTIVHYAILLIGFFIALAALGVDLTKVWTDRYEDWVQMRSDLSIAVDDALTRENITIA